MNKQKNYVPPGATICRITMEAGIADAVPTSIGPVSAQVEQWNTDDIYGDDPATEGGVAILSW
jgi:hypothetical protein